LREVISMLGCRWRRRPAKPCRAISARRRLKADPAGYLEKDFAVLLETVALAAGVKLSPENVPMPTGLEIDG
jgi:hypothetical protein